MDGRTRVTAAVLDALADPSEQHVAALRELMSDEVQARGPFVHGTGPAAVAGGMADPALPALRLAVFGEARSEDPQPGLRQTVLRGQLPPGLQISAVRLVLREREGRLVELVQEVELPPPPAPSPLVIDEEIAAAVDGAFAAGTPLVVGYTSASGAPRLSYRGTVQSHGPQTLALWVRDPHGGLLRAIPTNPQVALLYREPTSRTQYEITGRARRTDDPAERASVYTRCAPFEQHLDPDRKGVAVVIDVDVVLGGPPGRTVHLRRTPTTTGHPAPPHPGGTA